MEASAEPSWLEHPGVRQMARTLAARSRVRDAARSWGQARKDSDGPGMAEAGGRDELRRNEAARGVMVKVRATGP